MAEAVSATCSFPPHPLVFGLFRFIRRAVLLLFVALLAAAVASVVAAGRLIVDPGAREAPAQADAIIVLAGANADRWLEGYELWREGHAPRLVLSPGAYDGAQQELIRRGIHMPSGAEVARDTLTRQLGVPADVIEILPGPVDNTAAEAAAVSVLAAERGWRQIIVVTSLAHTRRTRYAMERELDPIGVQVQVRGSRFDAFDVRAWWQQRGDIRWVVTELPKLLAYRLGLGE